MNNLWCMNYSSVRTNTRFAVSYQDLLRVNFQFLKLVSVAEQTGLSLSLSEAQKFCRVEVHLKGFGQSDTVNP